MRERNATNKKFDEYTTYCVTGLAIRARGLAASLPLSLSSSPRITAKYLEHRVHSTERGAHLCTFARKIWGESADLNNRGRNTLKIPSSWHHGAHASRRFRRIYTILRRGRRTAAEKNGQRERRGVGGEREGNRNGMRKRERERRMLVNVAGVEVDLRSSGTL